MSGRNYPRTILASQFQLGQIGNLINSPAIDAVILIGAAPGIRHGATADVCEAIRVCSAAQGKSFNVLGERVQFRNGTCHPCLLDKFQVIRDGESGQDANDRDREHEFDKAKTISVQEIRSVSSARANWKYLRNGFVVLFHGVRLAAMRFERIQRGLQSCHILF